MVDSAYWIEDLSDEDGGDYLVWERDGAKPYGWECGRHFDRADAEQQLADLRYVEEVDAL